MTFLKSTSLLIVGVIVGIFLNGPAGEQPKPAEPALAVEDVALPLKRALAQKNAETEQLRRVAAQLTKEKLLIQREADVLRSRNQAQDQTLARHKNAVAKYTQISSGTISRAIVRNGAGGIIGFIPIAGDAATAAATAVDVAEYCRLSKLVDGLNREINGKAVNAIAQNEACRLPKNWKIPRLSWNIFR